jgi:hypothetical protein
LISWFFFAYPLLFLRSLSPHSVITNLHVFLFLCNSFLLLAGWWKSSCCCETFLPLWGSRNVGTYCQKNRNFVTWKKSEIFGIQNRIWRDTGTELLNDRDCPGSPLEACDG